jgi:hypothetical protein
VCCNSSRLFRWTAREQLQNRFCHACSEITILFSTAQLVPTAPRSALLGIGKTFFFSALKRRFPDQDALALAAATWLAETNNNCRKSAVLLGTACEGGLTTREVNQMIEIGTAQAKRVSAFQEEEIALAQYLATARAFRIAEDGENNRFFGP